MAERPPFGLRTHLEARWTERRAADVRAAIERRVRGRRVAHRAIAKSSLVLVAGVALALFVRQQLVPERCLPLPPMVAPSLPQRALAEPMATPLTADTELVVDPKGSGRAFVLRRGSARFVVPHDKRHPFRVRVGSLVVEDVGTIFSVARLSENRFEVVVDEGEVAVLCEDSRIDLGNGQRRIFECGHPKAEAMVEWRAPRAARTHGAPAASKVTVGPSVDPPRDPSGSPSGVPSGAPSEDSSAGLVAESEHRQTGLAWQDLAEQGQYREAYDSLRNPSQLPVRDETHELLLAADTARLSGHSREALPYLRRILLQHRDDPRAHLVAFTMGRVLLDELGQPAEAADAFDRARAAHGPLAEDALAREVEARARSGDAGRAHALAVEYQRSYPQGRRMRAVAKFGGLAP